MQNSPDSRPAVVLVSGGLDSTTCLAIARQQGFELFALSFDYGQRHRIELEASKNVAMAMGAKQHMILNLDLRPIGGSALTDEMEVPKDRDGQEMGHGIPITYVPARNTVFLSLALGWAEVLQCTDIFIGVNALDYSGYPDCRPEFIEAYENMANLATKMSTEMGRRLKIHAPLQHLTKAEIIKKGLGLGVDYSMTTSCYDPDEQGRACGHCDSCLLRIRGFEQAGAQDPTIYQP